VPLLRAEAHGCSSARPASAGEAWAAMLEAHVAAAAAAGLLGIVPLDGIVPMPLELSGLVRNDEGAAMEAFGRLVARGATRDEVVQGAEALALLQDGPELAAWLCERLPAA